MRVAAASFALALLAATPLSADTSLKRWFESLMRNGGGGSCCSVADCRVVDYRTGPQGYEAFVDGKWTAVPDSIVLHRHDNPTGGAVLCIDQLFRTMLCFVPGTEM
jgi:hypothetical protein